MQAAMPEPSLGLELEHPSPFPAHPSRLTSGSGAPVRAEGARLSEEKRTGLEVKPSRVAPRA